MIGFMKAQSTLEIETLIRTGLHTFTTIAKMFGVSQQRVGQINHNLTKRSRAEVRELYNVDQVIESAITRPRFDDHGWII